MPDKPLSGARPDGPGTGGGAFSLQRPMPQSVPGPNILVSCQSVQGWRVLAIFRLFSCQLSKSSMVDLLTLRSPDNLAEL